MRNQSSGKTVTQKSKLLTRRPGMYIGIGALALVLLIVLLVILL